MRNYIILNGKNSNEINGLLIQELPPISKPLIRTEVEEIDGRDGDIVTPLGYSAYDKEFTIGLYKDFDVNEVAAYFNSEGTVIFSNEPDKYYYYQITAQIDFERLVRYRTATVTMHCQPFKYSATEQPITEDVSGTVSDEGTNLALENTAEAPFNTLDIKGNTSQQTYSGKNLVYTSGKTDGGITATYNAATGETTISGTAVRTYAVFGAVADVLPAGTYTFSIQSAAPCAVGVATKASGGNRTGHNISTGATKTTFTISEDSEQYDIYLTGLTTNTAYSFTFKAMLEAGSSATSFEPYVGGTASPNPDYPQTVNTVTGENVVQICGKNLWGAEEHGSINENTGEDVWNANRWRTVGYIPVESNTAYTLSSNASADIWYIFCFYDSGKNFISGVAVYGGSQTQTTPANCKFMRCVVCDTASTKTTERQLELGSSASSFEPYQGQSYEVNLGKNLFDKDDASEVINAYIDTSAHKIATGNNYRTAFIQCEPNTTYTISKTLSARFIIATTTDLPANNVSVSQDIAKNTDTTYTITTNSTAKYLCVFLYHSSYDTLTPEQILATLQIEKGSTATSYAAYFEPIELCKIGVYQDSIYKSDGKWYVHKEVGEYTFTGNESPSVDTASTNTTRCLINNCLPADAPAQPQATGTGKSNYFEYRTNWSDDVAGIYSNNRAIVFRGAKTTIGTTQDAVKAWLASTNPMYYYALATPTDTEITNEALIEQLDNIYYHAHAYKGRTHITSSAATGNVPHIIAAEVGEDNESTITNAGNYLSKPKITVYGSGDISLYINDMHVLQITLGDEGYITIDTAQMEAYKDTLDNLKNRLVIGDYSNARLKPGANKIYFTGTVTKYIVENYSRWL